MLSCYKNQNADGDVVTELGKQFSQQVKDDELHDISVTIKGSE